MLANLDFLLLGLKPGLLFMEVLLFASSIFLMLLILVQRGKGGGLTGALGGMGGQSAFGSKAGDAFTKITVITAMIWITLCMITIAAFNPPPRAAKARDAAAETDTSTSDDSMTGDSTASDGGDSDDSATAGVGTLGDATDAKSADEENADGGFQLNLDGPGTDDSETDDLETDDPKKETVPAGDGSDPASDSGN